MPNTIVLALDTTDFGRIIRMVELAEKSPHVNGLKIGFQPALRFGLQSLAHMIRQVTEVPLIYDHQKAGTDIPRMGAPFMGLMADCLMSYAIIFPMAGPRTMERFVTEAFIHGVIPIVGLTMTHGSYLGCEGGYIRDEAPGEILEYARELEVHHFVLPGNQPDIVSSVCGGLPADVCIWTPGIGTQGGSASSVIQAARPNRVALIVGSAVTEAEDPEAALEAIAADMVAA